MELRNKNILLISPQRWGKMFLSKHHYAVELASRGNKVFFLNPPGSKAEKDTSAVKIIPVTDHPGLFLIEHRLFFPAAIKFHWIGLFHLLMKWHLKSIFRKLGVHIDIAWSFDLGNFYPFRFIPADLKIFHPVDEPLNPTAIESALGADIIFSTTNQILSKYKKFNVPMHFIQHGLPEEFVTGELQIDRRGKIRVGMAGNFTRSDIDFVTLNKIVNGNPEVHFEFWGPFEAHQSNIGSAIDEAMLLQLNLLRERSNVVFHGPVGKRELAENLRAMDAFLICYHPVTEEGRGTNYHKVLEYLSTGKVIVSSYITAYHRSTLLCMESDMRANTNLSLIFRHVIDNLQEYNSPDRREARISYAVDNTYARQVDRIEIILNNQT